jgi:hypothetical protein
VGGEAAAPEGLVAPVIEPVAEFEVDEDELADPPTDEVVYEPVAADEPANFFGSLVPPPQLTAGLLPDKLGDFVFDEADRMGADPAELALAVIIIATTAVSNVVRIAPMQKNDGWEEPPLLWGLLAGDPGSKKSPIMNAAMSPLLTAEMEWRKSDAYQMEQYHEELEDYQDKKRARRSPKHNSEDDGALEKPVKPAQRRLVSNDFTMETIAHILAQNPRGILLQQDEILEIIGGFDSYRANGTKKDRQAPLALFDAKPRSYDRKTTADEPILVPMWGGGIFGGIQPDMLSEKAANFKTDGLLQRFLTVQIRNCGLGIDRYPNQDAVSDYRTLIWNLANFNGSQPLIVKLSDAAHGYRERMQHLALAIVNSPAAVPARRGHADKLAGIFVRLLLTLHMVNVCPYWDIPRPDNNETLAVVSEQTAKQAFHLMRDFFIPHSVKLYERYFVTTGNQAFQDARWLADHILVNGLQRVTHSLLTKAKKEWRDDKGRRDGAVQVLVEGKWLLNSTSAARNGHAAWPVNTLVHERFAEHTEQERRERDTRQMWIDAGRRTLDKEYGDL